MKDESGQDKLNTIEAAELLGYTAGTMAVSRNTDELAGVKPPAHIKQGNKVYYKRETLIKWDAQFKEVEG